MLDGSSFKAFLWCDTRWFAWGLLPVFSQVKVLTVITGAGGPKPELMVSLTSPPLCRVDRLLIHVKPWRVIFTPADALSVFLLKAWGLHGLNDVVRLMHVCAFREVSVAGLFLVANVGETLTLIWGRMSPTESWNKQSIKAESDQSGFFFFLNNGVIWVTQWIVEFDFWFESE